MKINCRPKELSHIWTLTDGILYVGYACSNESILTVSADSTCLEPASHGPMRHCYVAISLLLAECVKALSVVKKKVLENCQE